MPFHVFFSNVLELSFLEIIFLWLYSEYLTLNAFSSPPLPRLDSTSSSKLRINFLHVYSFSSRFSFFIYFLHGHRPCTYQINNFSAICILLFTFSPSFRFRFVLLLLLNEAFSPWIRGEREARAERAQAIEGTKNVNSQTKTNNSIFIITYAILPCDDYLIVLVRSDVFAPLASA